jgi:hypothetical protein
MRRPTRNGKFKNRRTIMNSKKLTNGKVTIKMVMACVAIGWMFWSAGNICNAQTPPSNLSPDLQEVVKLSQSHMDDEVIINYIRNSGKSYKLGADDIIYLNGQGVSQGVISALQTASSANPNPTPPSQPSPAPYVAGNTPSAPDSGPPPAPQAEAPAPPPAQEVNFDYFHDQLAPFGTWVNVGGTMYWHPDQAIAANPDWRPYYDMGQWVQTDNGLYWQSDYTWGDIPFHYGRWVLDPVRGWLWAPDYTWGPAWVFWRQDEGDAAIGWAPLPVGAVFVGGAFMFNGVAVAADFDFGLGESCFTFVGYDHFHEGFFRMRGHEWAYHIDRQRLHGFFRRSVLRNDFRRDEHGRFVNNGIGRDRMERATRGRMEHSSFEDRNPVGDRNRLAAQRSERPGMGNADHFGAGNTGHPGAGSVSKVYRPPNGAGSTKEKK